MTGSQPHRNKGTETRSSSNGERCVVLIHGLGRSAFAMRGLAQAFRRQNYQVLNLDYPSTRLPIDVLARDYVAPIMARAADFGSIDVVTHSLGGILLRYYMAHYMMHDTADQLQSAVARKLHRAVMLAPPNQGSEVPDRLKRLPPARWILGPVMPALGTDAASVPRQLAALEQGQLPCDVGVIAGTKSWEPWFSRWMEGQDDGKVSVASTRLAGMQDFLEVPVGHTFIMNDAFVIRQVFHFLRTGHFQHGE